MLAIMLAVTIGALIAFGILLWAVCIEMREAGL